MAEIQDLEELSRKHIVGENGVIIHDDRIYHKLLLAQAEQTSRLADAVEGVLSRLEAVSMDDDGTTKGGVIHVKTYDGD